MHRAENYHDRHGHLQGEGCEITEEEISDEERNILAFETVSRGSGLLALILFL